MKLALVVHAWPEPGPAEEPHGAPGGSGGSGAAGGTELHVRALARELSARGHEVVVIAGSLDRAPGATGAPGATVEVERSESAEGFVVIRIRRPDLYFDHWHKSHSPAVTAEVRRALREEAVELVHVHHWLRLSRDLVLGAAREGLPAVLSLHDFFASCPLVFRAHPADERYCERDAGPHPCVACAGAVAPRTPWVETGQGYVLFAERQAALARELDLARAVAVPSEAHRAALARFLGRAELPAQIVPPAHRGAWPAAPRSSGAEPATDPGFSGGEPLRLASWSGGARHKGLGLVLAALTELRGRGAPIELVLAGVDDRTRAGLPPWVTAHGRFEPDELFEHPVARAHAMVCGSLGGESYGLVHDEALALGMPAVLPSAGAFIEREGRGVQLYGSGDGAGLVSALEALLRPGRLGELRAEALRARTELPTIGAVTEQLLGLYARAFEAGPPTDLPAEDWFAERMGTFALEQWDASLAAASADELGLE